MKLPLDTHDIDEVYKEIRLSTKDYFTYRGLIASVWMEWKGKWKMYFLFLTFHHVGQRIVFRFFTLFLLKNL